MNNHKKIDWLRWHKRKYFIRINCFIMVSILLIVLLLQFPIVHAEEKKGGNLKTVRTMSSYYYCNDFYDINYAGSLYPNMVTYNFFTSSGYFSSSPFNYYNAVQDIFTKQVDDFGSSPQQFSIFTKKNDNNTLIVLFSNVINMQKYGDGSFGITAYGGSPYYEYNISNSSFNSNFLSSGSTYSNIGYLVGELITSSATITVLQNNNLGGTDFLYNNINYLASESKCGIGAGGFDVHQPDNSASEHKRVYEGSCVYMQFSNLNTGNLHIVCKTDDFQKSNNYYVKLRVSCSTSVHQNALYTYKRSGSTGDYLNNFDVPNNTFNRGQYTEYDIPLSAFSNSGDYTIDLYNLNNGLTDSNERTLHSFASNFEDSSTGLKSAMESMVFSLLTVINYKFYDANASSYNVALDSFVYDVSVALCGSGNDASEEIFDSFTLDMVSGALTQQEYPQSTEDDVKEQLNTTIIPSNYVPSPQNPSYPDAYNVTVPNTPSNNNDNSDTNNNNVAPTNNNNVTNGDYSPSVVNNNNVTVEQGNRYPERGVMNAFVRIINNDKNNTVDDIDRMIGGNAYIQLCNHALSSVPSQVWNLWITCLKAILGILVSAFFLKILINWST